MSDMTTVNLFRLEYADVDPTFVEPEHINQNKKMHCRINKLQA